MIPAQIIALIRDALIVGALGFLIWRVYSEGENRVKLDDLQAVQKQLQAQAQTVARWHEEIQNAQGQRDRETATIADTIRAHSAPVLLCDAPRADHVPAAPSTSPSVPASPGRPDDGPGSRDIRPALAAFEERYEGTLADCRQYLRAWPQ